jgi:hypothetical protein
MPVAIVTKYHGPTETRGSRISADAGEGRRVSISYDHAASNPHDSAALALCAKMGWEGDLTRSGAPDGRGNVYTFRDDAGYHTVKNPTQGGRRLAS